MGGGIPQQSAGIRCRIGGLPEHGSQHRCVEEGPAHGAGYRTAIEDVFSFFDRWGAAWGARPDVIRRASPAVVELCEDVWLSGGPVEITIEMIFDEFRVSVDIRWSDDEARQDPVGLERLVGHLQQRYDCHAKLS